MSGVTPRDPVLPAGSRPQREPSADGGPGESAGPGRQTDDVAAPGGVVTVEPPSAFRSGFVAIVGRPNVGKSTFVNGLVGTKISIVSDKPQTTRNRILAVVNRPHGQLVLFDTPGIHRPEHRMNERMVQAAVKSVGLVDVVFWLIDVRERYGPGDRFVRDVLRRAGRPVLLGINKIDTVPKPHILAVIEEFRNVLDFAEIVPLSALTGDGVELAGQRLLAQLPEGEPLYPEDFLTDRPERFFVGEMVREQILRLTRQELPYTTGVLVESFKEEGQLIRIQASILAERDSQKAILIGRGGEMLKRIGTEARREIETFLGAKVFLGLFVKVRERWREDGALLDEMGVGDPARAGAALEEKTGARGVVRGRRGRRRRH